MNTHNNKNKVLIDKIINPKNEIYQIIDCNINDKDLGESFNQYLYVSSVIRDLKIKRLFHITDKNTLK